MVETDAICGHSSKNSKSGVTSWARILWNTPLWRPSLRRAPVLCCPSPCFRRSATCTQRCSTTFPPLVEVRLPAEILLQIRTELFLHIGFVQIFFQNQTRRQIVDFLNRLAFEL